MDLDRFLDRLGYAQSPHFLRQGTAEFVSAPDFGHVFRKAAAESSDSKRATCGLHGVYVLRRSAVSQVDPIVPLVYVCQADSEDAARKVHRLVWNQDVAPFVFVHTPQGIRVYSGFCYAAKGEGLEAGVLRQLVKFNAISELVDSFSADAIDSGQIWREWGKHVTPEKRVDWRLLENLQKLDWLLRTSEGLEKEVSHALIGKYVYLHYLRHRDILSDRKLESWKIEGNAVFGREATRAGLAAVTAKLDDWLNGSVFPLKLAGKDAPSDEVIGKVAGIFNGDDIVGESDRQLHLDFQAYDFSFIPIETLSVIYEQFLHAPEVDGRTTKGKEAAAYYTPIPVVNFMLAELEDRQPLRRGMTVFDPACGSGAFLVQCYRRLIEREFPSTQPPPKPSQLRELLQDHIFGIDSDPDACSVTELSLILTLLDYVDPPDLETKGRRPHLPSLRGENIFHTNFFKWSRAARSRLNELRFDWIVGNPPWKDLKPAELVPQDEPVWAWMSLPANKKKYPCGDNEVAQAFGWQALSLLSESGTAALLLPAMMLFEDPSRKFRRQFFTQASVTSVANFANLAEVLFAGRSRVPAAAVFFEKRQPASDFMNPEQVAVYSPLLANQQATRPDEPNRRAESWSLVLNSAETRDLSHAEIATGSGLVWKIATWGSARDAQLLRRMAAKHPLLGELEREQLVTVAEGPALVASEVPTGPKKTIYVLEVVGKRVLDVTALARKRHVFTFPAQARIKNEKHYASLRRGMRGLVTCRPRHLIVSAARTFAVYCDDYLIVPPRQIGIISSTNDVEFLKALSLYLSSDFAFYHQFLTATEFGVKRDRATLRALRTIPVPLTELSKRELDAWTSLHAKLVKTSPIDVRVARKSKQSRLLFDEPDANPLESLLQELNELVFELLGLDARERALVDDLVRVRLELNDGKLGKPAVRQPNPSELRAYASWLKADLDAFISDDPDKWHQVGIVYDDWSAMVQIDLVADKQAARQLLVSKASDASAKHLENTRRRLRKERAQWVYFDRNLRMFEGTKTFVFKPMQRFHWTASQAMTDASEIIAETLQSLETKA